ncbi:hypothetical protein LSTR_LSTR007419 [Laodelphax striatellus]|uniref:Ig-like domain-containing protein n=1 Tax=Laodelphax striatellus TaxID=195883 RepID=A0A482XNP1_LAOST|nr:hypothetical protein LSTR_LSTR007419 [Laodelphax striatellus]
MIPNYDFRSQETLKMESTTLYLNVLFLCFICTVHNANTAEPETTKDQWQPVYKTNSTKEWKAPTVQDAKWRDPSYVPNRREQVVTVYPSPPSALPFPIGQSPAFSKIAHLPAGHLLPFPPTQVTYALNRQDSLGAADSSYYSAYAAGPPGPPVYGPSAHYSPHHHHSGYPPPPPPPPPPFPSSDQQVMLELAFDKLVLRCSVEDPLEHLVWTRYPCPNEYFYGHGVPVAEGSVVNNPDLYDVRIVGEGGRTGSELLMKAPLDPASSGLYVCEAWPHYQKDAPGDYGNGHYGPPKPVYPAFSDVFIIGGSELLEECYKHPPHYHKKPLHLKKHYDEDFIEDDEPPVKISKCSGSKKSHSNVDAIRKPRNITRFENPFDVPRYNLRFENVTMQNASARDLFRSASAFSHLFRKDHGFQFMRNSSYQYRDNSTQPSKPSLFSIFKPNGFGNVTFSRNTTFQMFKKGDGVFGSSPFLNRTSSTQPKLDAASLADDENRNADKPESLSSSLFRKPSNDDKFRFGSQDSQDASSIFNSQFIKKNDDIAEITSYTPSEPVRNSDSLLSDATIYTSQNDRIAENEPSNSNNSIDSVVPMIKFEYSANENDGPWSVSDNSFAVPQMTNNSIQIDLSARKSKVL